MVEVCRSHGLIQRYREESQRLVGEAALVVGLLYGSGLRLMEALRLSVKDLDVQRRRAHGARR